MVGLAVEVVVDCCFVGWKEERARKAARKLERKGRGGCWVGEGMVGCEASLEGAMVVGQVRPVWEGAVVVSFAVVASSFVRPDQRVVLSVQRSMSWCWCCSTCGRRWLLTPPRSIQINSRSRRLRSVDCMLYRHHTRTKQSPAGGDESRGRVCGEMGVLSRGIAMGDLEVFYGWWSPLSG